MNENAVIQQIIQQLFSLIPGAGPMLSGFLGQPIADWLSPGSAMRNKFLWPGQGQGPLGTSLNYLDNIYNRSWGTGARAMDAAAQYRSFEAWHRALNPNATAAEIANMASNSMDNPLMGMVSSMVDPYGMQAGLTHARALATTIQSRNASFSIGGAAYANSVSAAIFGTADPTNKYKRVGGLVQDILDNPAAYGNMSVSDVMAVGKELILTNPQEYSTGTGSSKAFDSKRFRDDVRKLSDSLEPWKEIFGSDIPKLMTQLEALTGQSVSGQASSLNTAGLRMLSIMHTTGASIQHIAAYKDALAPSLMDPTGANRSVLGAHSVAADMVLGLSNTSVRGMTTQEFQRAGGAFYTGTARSKFADMYSLAFAKYAGDISGKTPEELQRIRRDFEAQYNSALANNGNNHQAALMAASGASSMADLEYSRYTDAFYYANTEGLGAGASRNALIASAVGSMSSNLVSGDIRSFLALSRDQKVNKIMADRNITDRNQALRIVDDIENQFAANMSAEAGVNVSRTDAIAWLTQSINEERQGNLAQGRQAILSAVSNLSGPGGFGAVLDKLRNKPKADFKELWESYTGGSDILEAIIDTGLYDTAALTDAEREKVLMGAMNFAHNNFASLSTTYAEPYKLLMSKDAKEKAKGARIMAELDKLSPDTLSKMDGATRAALIKDVTTRIEGLSEADLAKVGSGTIAKDVYLDRAFSAALGNREDSLALMLLDTLETEQHTSKESLKKSFLSRFAKDDKATIDEATKLFNEVSDKIGDVDNIDPMTKLFRLVEEFFNWIKSNPPK